MPKVVDIDKKREEIANSIIPLILEKGFCNITVSEVASYVGIAKGSIYNYFETKEDIIYQIIQLKYKEYDKEVELAIKEADSIKQKVLALFRLCISTDEKDIERRKLYREFVSICLNQDQCSMIDFKKSIKTKYIDWLNQIFKEGERQGILKTQSSRFSKGLFVMAEGVVLLSDYDSKILTDFIDELFELIELKKCN